MAAEVAGADDLVPQVDRAGAVAAEVDHVLAELAGRVDGPAAVGRVDQQHVGRRDSFSAVTSAGPRTAASGRNVTGKSAAAWSFQLAVDAGDLLVGVAPGSGCRPRIASSSAAGACRSCRRRSA